MPASTIIKKATFHARIVLLILYWEKRFVIKLPFKVMRKLINQGIYHCEIHPDSFISLNAVATCRLPHPFMIIVHRSALIGEHCTIYHGVTFGTIEQKSKLGPEIGKNVYIGCNSSVLGAIIIEDNVIIGAHSLILADVSANMRINGLHK